MTLTEALLLYLALTPIAFFVHHTNSVDLNGRLMYAPKTKFNRRALLLLVHDYFEVHCPWSWGRAKHHRLIDMKAMLGTSGRDHELLGHLVATDCDDPTRQEEIARKTYISRPRFWAEGTMNIFSAVPRYVLLVVVLVVAAPIALCFDGWHKYSVK